MKTEFKMDKFEKEFTDLKDKVNVIYQYIVGHEHDKAVGLIHWKTESEKRLKTLEGFRDKLIWIGIGMSIPTGLGVLKIIQFVSSLFVK